MTSKYNQMMYVNGLSAFVSFCTLVSTGTLFPAFGFYFANPRFAMDAAVLSASAVGGQFFIYSQVKEFGALVFAATMNVRQIVSIVVSYITYGHHITSLQVLGLAAVFAALFYKSYAGLQGAQAAAKGKDAESLPIAAAGKDVPAGENYKAAEQA